MLKKFYSALKISRFFSTLSFGLLLSCSLSTNAEVININAIDWCPQICVDSERPGYIIELVKEIFKDTEYQLAIDIYPWSRAIKNVSSGKADALLSPAKYEAPFLRFPEQEVGFQQMCFFTKADSLWQYTGVESLKDKTIGIAIDTSIEELNDYVLSHPDQFQFQPYHERYVAQNLAKLEKNRMDAFLFTKNTTLYDMTLLGKRENYRNAGCVSKAAVYMAFSPQETQQEKITAMIQTFDVRLTTLKENGFFEQLMFKYQIQ